MNRVDQALKAAFVTLICGLLTIIVGVLFSLDRCADSIEERRRVYTIDQTKD